MSDNQQTTDQKRVVDETNIKKTTKEELDSIEVEEKAPSFWQIVFSTMSAFLGVQSNKNRVRDFKHGNFLAYVVSGLIFTAIFIFCVVSVVKLVLSNAGM
jgi:hypothetical protein